MNVISVAKQFFTTQQNRKFVEFMELDLDMYIARRLETNKILKRIQKNGVQDHESLRSILQKLAKNIERYEYSFHVSDEFFYKSYLRKYWQEVDPHMLQVELNAVNLGIIFVKRSLKYLARQSGKISNVLYDKIERLLDKELLNYENQVPDSSLENLASLDQEDQKEKQDLNDSFKSFYDKAKTFSPKADTT